MKRKKYLIFMLVFMLLCNAVWTGPNVRTVHAEGTSLVQDGNFEDNTEMSTPIQTSDTSISNQGTIGDSKWVYYVSNTTRGANFQIIETGEGDATNKALKVFVDESKSEVRNGTIKQNFSEKLTAGTYQITIRAKAENVISATGNAAKIRFNLAGKFDSNKDLMASACTEWKEYSLEYTLDGTETGTSLEIQMYYMAPGGNWILDDISIVKISPKDPTITVSPTTLSLEEEKTGELTATLTDEDGVLGETPTYEWTSSDTTVATVNGEGATATVTAIKAAADPVTITVTAKSADASKRISATCNVTVSAKSNTGNEDTSIIADGGFDKDAVMEEPVEAQGKVGNTYVVSSIGNYGWECSPSAVGTTYQIIQEPDNSTANNVLKVLHDSTLTDNAATINGTFRQSYEDRLENGLEVGETYTVSARVKAVNAINSGASASKIRFNLNGNAATNDIEAKDCTGWKEVSFEYTPTAADSKKMLEIQIYYIAADGYWLFDDISIKKVQPKESTIKINPTSLSLEKGNSSELNAMLTVVDNEFGEGTTYTWVSEDDTIATVTGTETTATVTAVKAGTAAVTVTVKNVDASKSVSASCIVKVSDPADTENEATAIIVNGSFEKDAVMAEAVTAIGDYKASNIGYYGWESVPSAVGTTYQIIEAPENTSNKVLKVMHDPTISNNAITVNGSFRQSYASRYPNGLEAGVKYIVSICAKAVNASSPSASESNIQFNLSNKRVGSNMMASECTDWKEYSFEYVQEGADSKKYLQITPCNIAGGGYWLIDDISIKKAPVVTIDKAQVNLEIDSDTEIIATILDDDKVLGENPALSWCSNDTSVATVAEENGTVSVKAVGVGEALITVKSAYEGASAECVVKVTPKKIIVNGNYASELAGWTTGTATDVTYTSVAEGRTDNALKVAVSEGVTGAVSGVFEQLLDAKVTDGLLASGSKYIVTAYVKPVGANSDSTVTVSWYDSESATAVTNEIKADAAADNDGWIPLIFEFTAGDMSETGTKLAAQVSNLTSGYWLFDDISIKRVPYVSLTPVEMNIVVGERAEIDATMIDPDYILTTGNAFDYSSTDESIAKVDLRGRVTGISAGTTFITITNAYDANYSATCKVVVSSVDLTAIAIPDSLSLCEAEQQALAVTFTPSNATNQEVTWSSSDTGIAAVDANGLITGIREGTAVITATGAGNLTATCTVTVRKSNALFTEAAEITATTYQEAAGSFGAYVINYTGSEAAYKLYQAPQKGVLTVEEDGTYSYIPRDAEGAAEDDFIVIVTAGTESAFLSGKVIFGETEDGSDTTITVQINNNTTTANDGGAVLAEPANGWVEGTNTFTVTAASASVVLISNDGGATYTRLTAAENEGENCYSFTAENITADTQITVAVAGDLNGSGAVTNADITKLRAACAGKTALDSLQAALGDINGSGTITNADITRLRAACAGKKALDW